MNKQIAFTYSWKDTFKIAFIAGVMIMFIMVFLQPFDTFQSKTEYKLIKLSGYAFLIAIPILILHFLDRLWYEKKKYRWTLFNEAIYLVFVIVLISVGSYFYHHLVFSGYGISISNFVKYFVYYCIPFFPLLLPLLSYLRFTFGEVIITSPESSRNNALKIAGDNKDEEISLPMNRFIYAEAQQNYVDIYYINNDDVIEKEIVRSTFSNIVAQIPDAYQVHRSYLINLEYLSDISGNSRKRSVELRGVENQIPVSKKYYQAIKKQLQFRP